MKRSVSGGADGPQQKKFSFDTRDDSLILSQGMTDVAEVRRITQSDYIQESLDARLLPPTELSGARHYVRRVLLAASPGGTEEYGVREALADIFGHEATGLDCRTVHRENRLLVEYGRDITARKKACIVLPPTASPTPGEVDLLSGLGSVQKMLKDGGDEAGAEEAEKYLQGLEWFMWGAASPLFAFVLCHFNVLKNSTYTFRLLRSVLYCCDPWDDGPEDRIEFKERVTKIFQAWADEEDV